jgi:hypothetical protein
VTPAGAVEPAAGASGAVAGPPAVSDQTDSGASVGAGKGASPTAQDVAEVRKVRQKARNETWSNSEYRVTRHRGRGADSRNARVIFHDPDEGPAQRFYQQQLPPKPGYVVALWRPGGALINFTAGRPPSIPKAKRVRT